MNTAIQELIEWTNKYKGQMVSADQVVLQAHKALEKEKEQIVKAFASGWNWNSDPEKYYQENYNQKQYIIDIMKADEDDGLYNQN
jgi:hypothetical protein